MDHNAGPGMCAERKKGRLAVRGVELVRNEIDLVLSIDG